jgi:hypothetical protein
VIIRDNERVRLTCDYCGCEWPHIGDTATALRENARTAGWVNRRLYRHPHDYCRLCEASIAALEDLRRIRKRR